MAGVLVINNYQVRRLGVVSRAWLAGSVLLYTNLGLHRADTEYMGENPWLRKPTEHISITLCIMPLILGPIFRALLSSAWSVSEVCRGG